MNANFARALPLVLAHEGGFVNHPKDPGGATNKGITIATFRRMVKRDGTVADLKAITPEQVAKVYRRGYWDAVKADELPFGVDYAVFDFAVNSGPGTAVKFLQKVLGTTVDSRIGPQTIAAAKAMDPFDVIDAIARERLAYLKRLKTWPTFGKGWERRVKDMREDALQMATLNPAKPIPATPFPDDGLPADPNGLPPAGGNSAGWIVLAATVVSGIIIAGWDWIVAVTGIVSPWW